MNKNIYTSVLEYIQEGKKVCIVSRLEKLEGNVETDLRKEVVFSSSEEVVQVSLEEKIPKYIVEPKPTIVEPFYPEERLIILGGGHIAVPLVEFASKAGFQVTVVDDRLSFSNKERFPLAKEVVCDSFESGIMKLNIRESDYVVIITRGHRYDSTCLQMICQGEKIPSYVGMIGSKRRTAIVKDTLEQEGCKRELLDKVYTPIGLSIGAITPEEISISILAELISHKRLGETDTQNREKHKKNSSDIDYELMQILAKERDIPKSVITVIKTKGSTPRGAGAKMIVYRDGMIIGSIGGGCSEAAVIGEARQIVGKRTFKVMDIDLTGDAAEEEGMVCGGIMTVLMEDFITE